MQKYIDLSNDAKVVSILPSRFETNVPKSNLHFFYFFFYSQVTAEIILLESNNTTKAILELIPILNITNLVIGIKKPPHLR